MLALMHRYADRFMDRMIVKRSTGIISVIGASGTSSQTNKRSFPEMLARVLDDKSSKENNDHKRMLPQENMWISLFGLGLSLAGSDFQRQD
nr:hypothetical protein [Tanacetum cinerariifolium]